MVCCRSLLRFEVLVEFVVVVVVVVVVALIVVEVLDVWCC